MRARQTKTELEGTDPEQDITTLFGYTRQHSYYLCSARDIHILTQTYTQDLQANEAATLVLNIV